MSSNEAKATFKITNPKEGPKLSASQLTFMRLLEKENLERVAKLERIRKRNIWTGWALGATVLGIYAYSILSIKQEKFLDDFEEPKKVYDQN